MVWHKYNAKEWGALSVRALNPPCISYKLKINSRTVKGESNGSGAQFTTGGQDGEGNEEGEGATGQATGADDKKADVSVHGFWKCGTSALFDIQIVNVYTGSYLH